MNYKKIAKKGRYGDSELRNVGGRTSHVNPREADLIDLWGALGESLVQREGAGTRNPRTGMPEYHIEKSWYGPKLNSHNFNHAYGKVESMVYGGSDESVHLTEEEERQKAVDDKFTRVSSEEFRDVWGEGGTEEEQKQFLIDMGLEGGDLDFFDPANLEQLGYLEEEYDLGTDRIDLGTEGIDLNVGKAETDYTATRDRLRADMRTVKRQQRTGKSTLAENLRAATSAYGIGKQQIASDYTMGTRAMAGRATENLRTNLEQSNLVASQSGMATSGTVSGQRKAAGKGVWQDYTTQSEQLATNLSLGGQRLENAMTGATKAFDIGTTELSDIYKGAQEDYSLGMTGARTTRGYTLGALDIDKRELGLDMEQLDIDRRQGVSSFWEDYEKQFYDTAYDVYTA